LNESEAAPEGYGEVMMERYESFLGAYDMPGVYCTDESVYKTDIRGGAERLAGSARGNENSIERSWLVGDR
jgi:hypothetical protein